MQRRVVRQEQLRIPWAGAPLAADLVLPAQAAGLVLFAHGSGSDRHSPRNRQVAEVLQEAGLATLLLDLGSWGQPLLGALDWCSSQKELTHLPLGLFGASSGAALALEAAAARPTRVGAVVCRGGRPDLAFEALGRVRCPTLLIVGSSDLDVLELNAWAAAHLRAHHDLLVVPRAGHLFAEPGALEAVAQASCDWFLRHLAAA
jgi:pimeloyl-ACP methyl ester carboxylesterase